MLPQLKPTERHAIVFLGSLWAVAIVFLIATAFVPG